MSRTRVVGAHCARVPTRAIVTISQPVYPGRLRAELGEPTRDTEIGRLDKNIVEGNFSMVAR